MLSILEAVAPPQPTADELHRCIARFLVTGIANITNIFI